MSTVLKIESTKAKTRFASLPRQAQVRDVAITRHGHIQAYVLSPERYAHLSAIEHIDTDVMQKLDDDFEAMLTRMQSRAHARATEQLASAPLETILDVRPAPKPRKGKQPT